MEPVVTPGSKENSAQEHARRVAAQQGLLKLYLELKAQLDLSDRLDSVIDRFLGAVLLFIGMAAAYFCISYLLGVVANRSLPIAVTVRYASWLLAGFCFSLVLAVTGAAFIRIPMSVHPATVVAYALIIAFILGVIGLLGVIPIAILFP